MQSVTCLLASWEQRRSMRVEGFHTINHCLLPLALLLFLQLPRSQLLPAFSLPAFLAAIFNADWNHQPSILFPDCGFSSPASTLLPFLSFIVSGTILVLLGFFLSSFKCRQRGAWFFCLAKSQVFSSINAVLLFILQNEMFSKWNCNCRRFVIFLLVNNQEPHYIIRHMPQLAHQGLTFMWCYSKFTLCTKNKAPLKSPKKKNRRIFFHLYSTMNWKQQ